MNWQRWAGQILCLAALAGSPAFVFGQSQVSEADDAYHYKYWQGTPLNAAYTEWWYFNLYDAKDDVQAIFSYLVLNPSNAGGFGSAQMAAVAYEGSKTVSESDFVPLSSFSASYSAANVMVGSNTVSVTGPNEYLITGSTADGRLVWNLYYEREADSWYAANRVDVAPAAWEQMSWLLYMPRARVSGTLTIDGKRYEVSCPGYHDHNWGKWNFEGVKWNWAQYSQPDLAFDLGDFVGNPNGRVSIAVNGQRAVFPASQYQYTHTKWAYDPVNLIPYPTESVLTADNGTLHLAVTLQVTKSDPLSSGPAPSMVIYEQPTHFEGVLTDVTGGSAPAVFSGDGFSEYTNLSRVAGGGS